MPSPDFENQPFDDEAVAEAPVDSNAQTEQVDPGVDEKAPDASAVPEPGHVPDEVYEEIEEDKAEEAREEDPDPVVEVELSEDFPIPTERDSEGNELPDQPTSVTVNYAGGEIVLTKGESAAVPQSALDQIGPDNPYIKVVSE